MDYPWAERFGELARDAGIALSVHAPLAGFMGQVERDKKHRMAIGMLDHSAGVAVACGAELVVIHPGFLLGRERKDALAAVVEQLGELRERLEGKGRGVPFGVEVMGRVRELGTAEDVFAIAAQLQWVRPVIDFAHLHAVTDGGFTEAKTFHGVLKVADTTPRKGSAVPHPLQRHRRSRTGTRRSTCPTARAPSGPSRWPRRSRSSSGRRR